MSVQIFGIRHHGVGSARSLLAALEAFQPDCLLIEGPPDADPLLPLLAHPAMEPPIAVLVYDPAQPRQAGWYPLAIYSPEWQALRWGQTHGAAVRFMDLPLKHRLALDAAAAQAAAAALDADPETSLEPEPDFEPDPADALLIADPLGQLAALSGEPDGERWWGRLVEEVSNPVEIFAAIHDAMAALRTAGATVPLPYETEREAFMRTQIRAAEKQFQRVAVVCGAWHSPALTERVTTKTADAALLKGLPSVKVAATITPWTYGRLALSSGYGAGVVSPGWYHHLWETPPDTVAARWLSRVAALLRDEGLLASTAQVIDAVRLADLLAGLRGHAIGLAELNEAALAVLCAGRPEPLALIHARLIVSNRLGSVPLETPAVPLRTDLTAQQKKLRLPVKPDPVPLALDLRQPTDLARSQLFHRLNLLGLPWATERAATVRSRGTFREDWQLHWTPELDIRLIEVSVWGSTITDAAAAFVEHTAATAQQLSELTTLLSRVLNSDLPQTIPTLAQHLSDRASLTHDVGQLLEAAPPLIETARYGDVRQTASELIAPVLESIIVRACIGLPVAAMQIDDDAARVLYNRVLRLDTALLIAPDAALTERWFTALHALPDHPAVHPLLAGTATRLLRRAERLSDAAVTAGMRRAFSVGNTAQYGAYWLEGFLTGVEHVLLRDDGLFALIDAWLVSLSDDAFMTTLPLLRRTFARFDRPVRRGLVERVQRGTRTHEVERIDEARAARVLPLLRQLLGGPV